MIPELTAREVFRRTLSVFLLVAVTGAACIACRKHDSNGGGPYEDVIKSDERVIFFPTDGWKSDDGTAWHLRIHGWIFEPEKDSFVREQITDLAASYFDDEVMTDERRMRFEKRLRYFIVDNESGKELTVRIAGKRVLMPESDGDGRFQTTITLPAEPVRAHAENGTISFQALPGRDRKRKPPAGVVHLTDPEGVTVISDVDDTIKISHAHDREELLRRTFLMPHEPVPGMAQTYRRWAKREHVRFLYLSSSPWQLYPSLRTFVRSAKFPAGPFDLLRVQLDDLRLLKLFDTPAEKKRTRLKEYFRRYPRRKFMLIGDAGEADPEIYGNLAREYPDRTRSIFIRRVEGGRSVRPERFRTAFEDVPDEKWTVFDDPGDLTFPE